MHAGYLTPLGAGAYWTDCYYPLNAAFVYFNGSALVFSVAAIVVVLIGPIILVWLDRSTWRKQVAILSILHLAFSLASFVVAFALAGFVTAAVNAPPINCGNLKCEEGGVPCYAYTLRHNGSIYARFNKTIDAFEEVGTYSASEDTIYRSGESRNQKRAFYELVLDPLVAQLNNDTFGDVKSWETPGNDVICRDYRYLANNAFHDGRPVFRRLNNSHGQSIEKSCLVLLDASFDSSFTSKSEGPSRLAWRSYKPNAHTLWCSTNTTNLGHGYLPLTLRTSVSLMASLAPDALLGTPYRDFNEISRGPESYALDALRCPNFSITTSLPLGVFATPSGTGVINLSALQLLSESENAWGEKGDADYNFPGEHVDCNSESQLGKFNQVFRYADSLGWDRSGFLFKASRNGEYVDRAVCQDRPYNSSPSGTFPLRRAKLYASLRYQCSSLSKGVLCDFGVDPPLAVDLKGDHLSKKNLPGLANVVLINPPNTGVKLAVIFMLIAVVVSNMFSVLFLTCWSRFRTCTGRSRSLRADVSHTRND